MRLGRPSLALLAIAPLLAGMIAAPSASAAAATTCTTWNGSQPGDVGGDFSGVAVVSSCDVWAVGSSDLQTLIEHWTGGSWVTVGSPAPGADSDLSAISAISASDIWAVGQEHVEQGDVVDPNASSSQQTLILHWDGTNWTPVHTPAISIGATLSGVSAVSAHDIWAVGSGGTYPDRRSLMLHWDGTMWSQVAIPSPGPANVLVGVSADSSTDAWAVGMTDPAAYGSLSPSPYMLHWNGAIWAPVSIRVPVSSAGFTALDGVSATSPSDAWAVGSYEAPNPAQPGSSLQKTLVMHWDGASWNQVTSPNPINPSNGPATDNELTAVTAVAPDNAWAVGDYGGNPTPYVMHWQGNSWDVVAVDPPGQGTLNRSLGVAASAAGQAWVVGYHSVGYVQPFAAPVPVVPDLTGDMVGGAHADLVTYGLRGGALSYTPNCPAASNGLVVGSDPPAGQIKSLGDPVNLVVCSVPHIMVPNVLYDDDDESAQYWIANAGLAVGTISYVNDCSNTFGTVLSQNPSGGTDVLAGSAVNLTEASGMDPRGGPCAIE